MGKKKPPKVLIVGDDPELFRIVANNNSLLNCEKKKVKQCDKALQVASEEVTFFDFLVTDLASTKINVEEFAEQFIRLSPSTKVIFTII
jgi:DNA-binding NtrC family response regulator